MKRPQTIILSIVMLVMIWMLSSQAADRCHELWYRAGKCYTMALNGMDCNPEDNFVMPVECRNAPDHMRPFSQGSKEVDEALRKLRGK